MKQEKVWEWVIIRRVFWYGIYKKDRNPSMKFYRQDGGKNKNSWKWSRLGTKGNLLEKGEGWGAAVSPQAPALANQLLCSCVHSAPDLVHRAVMVWVKPLSLILQSTHTISHCQNRGYRKLWAFPGALQASFQERNMLSRVILQHDSHLPSLKNWPFILYFQENNIIWCIYLGKGILEEWNI